MPSGRDTPLWMAPSGMDGRPNPAAAAPLRNRPAAAAARAATPAGPMFEAVLADGTVLRNPLIRDPHTLAVSRRLNLGATSFGMIGPEERKRMELARSHPPLAASGVRVVFAAVTLLATVAFRASLLSSSFGITQFALFVVVFFSASFSDGCPDQLGEMFLGIAPPNWGNEHKPTDHTEQARADIAKASLYAVAGPVIDAFITPLILGSAMIMCDGPWIAAQGCE